MDGGSSGHPAIAIRAVGLRAGLHRFDQATGRVASRYYGHKYSEQF